MAKIIVQDKEFVNPETGDKYIVPFPVPYGIALKYEGQQKSCYRAVTGDPKPTKDEIEAFTLVLDAERSLQYEELAAQALAEGAATPPMPKAFTEAQIVSRWQSREYYQWRNDPASEYFLQKNNADIAFKPIGRFDGKNLFDEFDGTGERIGNAAKIADIFDEMRDATWFVGGMNHFLYGPSPTESSPPNTDAPTKAESATTSPAAV